MFSDASRRLVSSASDTAFASRPTRAKASIGPVSTLVGSNKPPHPHDAQPAADPEQHDRVGEGGEDLGAVEAERTTRGGRQRRDVRRGQRHPDRGGIGHHMARVGHQREGAGDPGADDVDHDDGRGDHEHELQPGSVESPALGMTVRCAHDNKVRGV